MTADAAPGHPATPSAVGPAGSWARRVLVALGGNAMSGSDGSASEADQIAALTAAAGHLADLVQAGVQVAITHGNGPQVGNLLVKNELSAHVVPPVSLDWCVASTQASIGFVLANALQTEFGRRGIGRDVAALVTRTLVDPDDPAFADPVKPVGRYLPREDAEVFIAIGQQWRDFGARGWRRVVASPRPVEILDARVATGLVAAGAVVICSGGGGIPVVRDADGSLRGVEAVIDKDSSAAILADLLDCDALVIATDVEHAVLGYGTPDARPLGLLDATEMAGHLADGHFAAGSMGPKVAAAQRFADHPGRTSVITRLDLLAAALTTVPDPGRPDGVVGTVIRHLI